MSSFIFRTEKYYGSEKNIHTVSWKGHGEIDSREIKKWCIDTYGKSGYREDTWDNRWIDNTKNSEIMLCNDEDLTMFLLRWQ